VLLFILLTIVVAISLAEYIIWTPLAAKRIEGLQFRYYLPLIPFAFLLLPGNFQASSGKRIRAGKTLRKKAVLWSTAALLIAVLYTPWVVAHRYYNLGLSAALGLAFK
jgi:uncharacterized membrane protein